MKKMFALLVVLTQLFAIAAVTHAEEAGAMAYEEILLQIPKGYEVSAMDVGPDGSILVLARSATSMLSQSLLRWKGIEEVPEEIPLALSNVYINTMDIAADGAILLCGNEMGQSAGPDGPRKTLLIWCDVDGNETGRFTVETSDYSPRVEALSGKRVAVTEYTGEEEIIIYDGQGEVLRRIDPVDARVLLSDADTLYALSNGAVYTWPLDAIETEKATKHTVSWSFLNRGAVDGEGNLYAVEQGIYAVNLEDGSAVQRMNALGFLFGDPSMSMNGFNVLSDGSFVLMLMNFSGTSRAGSIAVYRQTEMVENRTPFVITSFYSYNTLVQRAASELQKAHPELAVQIRALYDFNTGVEFNREDIIRTLNTELLGGGGGDVIVLDNLPYKAMMDRGILRDISHMVPEMGLLPGIEKGSRHADGKTYAVPAEFSVTMLWGKRDALATVETFADILDITYEPEQTLIPAYNVSSHIGRFLASCMWEFQDDQGRPSFTSPEFIAFLEMMYEMFADAPEAPAGDGSQIYNAVTIGLRNGNYAVYPAEMGYFRSLTEYYTFFGQTASAVILMPSISEPSKAYGPRTLLAIPVKGKQPEISEEFIRLVFEDDTPPSAIMNDSFSTIGSKLDELFAYQIERSKDAYSRSSIRYADGFEMELFTPNEAFLEGLRAQLGEVSRPVEDVSQIVEFVMEEIEPFFAGRITAEEAAKAIEQRAWLYLNE